MSVEMIDYIGTAFFTILPGLIVATITYFAERRHPFFINGAIVAIVLGSVFFFTPNVGIVAKIGDFLFISSFIYWFIERITRKKRERYILPDTGDDSTTAIQFDSSPTISENPNAEDPPPAHPIYNDIPASNQALHTKNHFRMGKYETFYTCPACGSLVSKGTYTCDCGFAFRRSRDWQKIYGRIAIGLVIVAVLLGCSYASFRYGQSSVGNDRESYAQSRVDAIIKEIFAGQIDPFSGNPMDSEASYRTYLKEFNEYKAAQ